MKLSFINPIDGARLIKLLAQCTFKKVATTKLRFCNTGDVSDFLESCVDQNNKKIIFLAKYQVKPGYVFVDQFENLYQIVNSKIETVSISNDIEITTVVCDYVEYALSNPFRNYMNQNAKISQTISDLQFENIQNLTLNFEQKAEITQNMSLVDLIDSANEENKYLFKPVSNLDSLIQLAKEIANCARELNELENKIINSVLKETKGLIHDIAELIVRKIKN